ncbi:hypothetical protein JCM10207_001133 [Rhodosporidiobolus poonsookiae]
MADLQAYLAAKYMSGAKADAILDRSGNEDGKRRKKKRKVDAGGAAPVASGSGGGLVIADDDGMGWGRKDDEEEEYKPVVEERRGQFKAKAKADSWATIRDADPSLRRTPTPEPEDEAPYVVSTTVEAAPRGGLQSAADLRLEQERKAAEQERKRLKAQREEERRVREAAERGEDLDDPNATVYRDASGRRIDVKLAKAEKAKAERDRMEKEMAKMEWGKGLVQKEDKEKAKREAEALKNKGMARYADDKDMNEEMKEIERWNDPAAAFLTKKKEKKKSSGPKFPTYQGPTPAPNRFGIPPGYRWDGVDRGNGFEARMMQKRNSRSMFSAAAHAFSTEDM